MINRVLMTGATGFLGSNLLKLLLINGFDISILKRRKSDLCRIQEIFDKVNAYNIEECSIDDVVKKIQPDIIIHCATEYGRKNTDPSIIIEANLILPLKLLEVAKKNNVKCFINTDTFLDKGINHYSLSKKQFKDWLCAFSSDLICVNIVLEHFYGPFDDRTKFVSFLIHSFIYEIAEIDLTLGEQKRDFIYIDDVVNAFIIIIHNIVCKTNGFYEYEIGTNEHTKIKDLVESIKKITNNKKTKSNYGALPYRTNEIMNSVVNTKAIFEIGWIPTIDLQTGLKKTIEAEIKLKK
jgi:CDP-paratose synthetase